MSDINYKLISLNAIVTKNKPGTLVDLDINKICEENNIKFNSTKSFYITNLNSIQSRGNHSNSNASEILVCLKGTFDLTLFNGNEYKKITLKENDLIYIDKNIWLELNNFKDCIILAFVSICKTEKKSCYDIDDYKREFGNLPTVNNL
jgi:oxalate decarboxylase/phosphoglucose isomerase-like protein (cupin superfamily)